LSYYKKSCIRKVLFCVKFKFLWIGKTKDPLFAGVENRYLGRINKYFSTESVYVPDFKKRDPRQRVTQLARESQKIESKLSMSSYIVVLDDAGKQFTSRELASFFEDLMSRGVPEMNFVAGGHLGIPEKIKNLAKLKLSLTRLTLPHEMVRMILLEQIYRAITIVKGTPYHN